MFYFAFGVAIAFAGLIGFLLGMHHASNQVKKIIDKFTKMGGV